MVDNHQSIVTREVWQAVHDKIQEVGDYNPTVQRMVKPSVFSGKIIRGKCGYHYVKSAMQACLADGLQENWICMEKIKYKKKFCDSPGIRGDRLREAAAQAMGLEEFDGRIFTETVDQITVSGDERLEFHFYDGTVKEVPDMRFRKDQRTTIDPHVKFPGYEWTQQGYRVMAEEAEMVRMVFRLYADDLSSLPSAKKSRSSATGASGAGCPVSSF